MDKTLDDILNYLKSTIFIEDQNYIQYINAVDIFFECYGEDGAKLHNYTEPKLFLDKLYNDGLVNFQENENAYQINLQGIEFINKGGYTSRTKDSKLKNFWSIIKIIAIALNAIVLIIFAYFSFKKDRYEMGNQNKVQIEKSDSLKKAQ